MYYLTMTARKKNAKRHVIMKSKDLDVIIKSINIHNECNVPLNPNYIFTIEENWKTIKVLN